MDGLVKQFRLNMRREIIMLIDRDMDALDSLYATLGISPLPEELSALRQYVAKLRRHLVDWDKNEEMRHVIEGIASSRGNAPGGNGG